MSSHPPSRPRRLPSVPAATSAAANQEASRALSSQETAQPLYINGVSSSSSEVISPGENAELAADGDQQLSSRTAVPSEEDQPRKCWICFSDETEDDPMSSEWRSPCPCALTAHESCLLDWVADLQGPGAHKGGRKILCPQCKSEIQIKRPQSVVVDAVRTLDLAAGYLRIPAIISTVGGCVLTGCTVFGIHTIVMIFGVDDAEQLIPGGANAFTVYRALSPFVGSPEEWSWRLSVGLPLIPGVLVLSRMKLGDALLPFLPVLFFVTQHNESDFNVVDWPPSAVLTLAVLPFLRGSYNLLFEYTFGEKERRWIREARPRGGESVNEAPAAAGNAQLADDGQIMADAAEEDVLVQLDIELRLGNEENVEEPPAEPPLIPEVQQAAGGDVQNPVPQQQPAAAQQNMTPLSHVTDTVIGALFFPAISAAMGKILELILPKSWTSPSVKGSAHSTVRRGLLQARWGRSIVGGCLFVVLKDAIILYSKYRRAQQHRETRIVDYKGSKGRKRSIR